MIIADLKRSHAHLQEYGSNNEGPNSKIGREIGLNRSLFSVLELRAHFPAQISSLILACGFDLQVSATTPSVLRYAYMLTHTHHSIPCRVGSAVQVRRHLWNVPVLSGL